MPRKVSILFIFIFIIATQHKLLAQHSINDTIIVTARIINGDTVPYKQLREVRITEKAPTWYVKAKKEQQSNRETFDRLRYNVMIVYPYAIKATYILKDVDSVMNTLYSKEAKQQYKQSKENELNKQFKNELVNLTTNQGSILVKLISRQTNRRCYDIIKDLKGGFNASIFQGMALLFDNNLKNSYDANGNDALIEYVVKEIEQQGSFQVKK